MSNFVVIGAGLLGNELKKIIVDMGHDVKIIQKVEPEQQVIPDGSDIVIITAQSADYKESNLTPDLLPHFRVILVYPALFSILSRAQILI